MTTTEKRIAPGDPGYAEALREIQEAQRVCRHSTVVRCLKCGRRETHHSVEPLEPEMMRSILAHPCCICGGLFEHVMFS